MKVVFFALAILVLGLLACQFFSKKQPPKLVAASPAESPKTGALRTNPPRKSTVVVTEKMNGLTMVAPWEPFKSDPMTEVKAVAANWIAVVPYAFSPSGKGCVIYNEKGRQWWGERPEGVLETVRLAHAAGIKVMLKPQVWCHGIWTGSYDFDDETIAAEWEADYEKYLLQMAQLAENQHIELLCIGTEFRTLIKKRPQFWFALIKKIRAVYHGKLTYSANWDDWADVPFWPKMDFVGLGGYFPLVDEKEPSAEKLTAAWEPIRARLEAFSDSLQKSILFTEYGYLSVDGCSWKNWELESGIENRPINQAAQAAAMDALHAVFQKEKWWAGGFLWKWFPNMMGHEGYPERDYTPQGKQAEAVLKTWFSPK